MEILSYSYSKAVKEMSISQIKKEKREKPVMIQFSKEQLMKFINLYEHHQCLWMHDDPHYKDKEMRRIALLDMIKEMDIPNFSIAECKEKIKNVRSQYLQGLKKVNKKKRNKSTHRPDLVYVPSGIWFDQVDGFLRKYIHHKKNFTPDMASQTSDFGDNDDSDDMEDPTDLSLSHTPNSHIHKMELPSQSHMAIIEHDYYQMPKEPEQKIKRVSGKEFHVTRKTEPQVIPMKREDTEFDFFGKSIATQLNHMPIDQALRLQLEIQQVVTNFRLSQCMSEMEMMVEGSAEAEEY